MRYFVCLIDPNNHGIPTEVLRAYEALPRARALGFKWIEFDQAAVLTVGGEPWGDHLVAKDAGSIGTGLVQLDNRDDLERWAGAKNLELTDLQLVVRLVAETDTNRIRDILGDFAFVVWNAATRTAVAATDALGRKKLYYSQSNGLIAFASRAEALALDDGYDVQYLAELVGRCTPAQDLTAFANVRRLPAAMLATVSSGKLRVREYWSPYAFEEEQYRSGMEEEAPRVLRELLRDSVRCRLLPNGATWAQLSGGLDSSSIVSTAQHMARNSEASGGLGGTVTFVDLQRTEADEREYSDAVARHWKIRNETIVDPPFWVDPDYPPPQLDQPSESLPFYPRSQRLCDVVRRAGGRSLLAGFGGDELFTGSTLFFADRLARGRLLSVTRELARWSAIGRVSFWQLGYSNALLPLLPVRLRHAKSVEEGGALPWISSATAARYDIKGKTFTATGNHGRFGHKYHDAMVHSVLAIMSKLDNGVIGEALDVRCPFLYRPLVEFALRLPPELCARPQQRKWVLREAMKGILPETIRTRVGKGAPTEVLVRALTEQRGVLEALTTDSMLAELSIVDQRALSAALKTAPLGNEHNRDLSSHVHLTLMVEAWLRIRSGRWPWGHRGSSSTKQEKYAVLNRAG